MITIMALAVDARAPAGWAGWIIGMAVGGVIMALGPATGASLNPARTFGPYVGDSIFGGPNLWKDFPIYVVGPVVGALVAAFVYTYLAGLRGAGHRAAGPGLPTRSRGGGEDVADPRGRAAVIRRDRVRIHWR